MSDANSARSELESSLLIDRLCDEFERQCRGDDEPQVADYLDRVAPELRGRLLEQLLLLELESRTATPKLAEYVERFPEYAAEVRKTFDELDLIDWQGMAIGPFQILNEIARGGMGVVYLANDSRLDRRVAIKVLSRDRRSDAKWLRRFRREARLASGLNHPNILTIYEIGEENDTWYIACEFVDGLTLREQMANGRLPADFTLRVASQVASGMVAAHEAGIVHRDLKPDNIMMRPDGLLKILDFGLAKEHDNADQLVSRTGSITGTVHFMSPEQARGQKLTTATDVFSFGSLLYLSLTGTLPFQGESTSDVLASILNEDPPGFASLGVSVKPEIECLVLACLNKSPLERPSFADIIRAVPTADLPLGDGSASDLTPLPAGQAESAQPQPTVLSAPLAATRTDLEPGPIRYAQSGDVNIAWQEIGSGPIDLVFVMGWVSHLDWFWKDPSCTAFLQRLATFSRVILFDKRGTGLSDRVPVDSLPNLETRMDDVRAVMEAARSDKAVLCGVSEGGPLCALFAATYPRKTIALNMIGSYSRRLWATDYPWGPTPEKRAEFVAEIAANWGGPLGIEDRAPSKSEDPQFRDWWASYLRMGASPGAAVALTKMNAQIDVRAILGSIHVPTLVIHRQGDRCLRIEEGRYLADKIPGAKFVELPGSDHLPFVGDATQVLDEIEVFLTGLTHGSRADYVLATVLHAKINKAISAELKRRLRDMVEREIALFRGANFFELDDALHATFDGPMRAVLCALEVGKLAARLGVSLSVGLDTGTCNIDALSNSGPAVDGAQSVAELAGNGGILATQTLKNLISGPKPEFSETGIQLENQSTAGQLYSILG